MEDYASIFDIPQFPRANWQCNYGWKFIQEGFLTSWPIIDMDPDYQRGYVWTQYQKERFIEHRLRGGMGGRDVYWNCPNWNFSQGDTNWHETMELVDGKQRIGAVLEFMNDKVMAFGKYLSEYKDAHRVGRIYQDFIFHVNTLATKREVVEWYLGLNAGGSIHTEEDLALARNILKGLD